MAMATTPEAITKINDVNSVPTKRTPLPERKTKESKIIEPVHRRSVFKERVSILAERNFRTVLLPAQARAVSKAMVIPSILLPLFIEGQDRPLPFNLRVALAAAVDDPQCVAIVLSAAGRAFCVGYDLVTAEEIGYCKEHKLSTLHDGNLPKKMANMHVWFVRKTFE
jgi:hypothetical protein